MQTSAAALTGAPVFWVYVNYGIWNGIWNGMWNGKWNGIWNDAICGCNWV